MVRVHWDGFSEADWLVMESALGASLASDVRQKVEELTTGYFVHLQAEQSPSAAEVTRILQGIGALASRLVDELSVLDDQSDDMQAGTRTAYKEGNVGSFPVGNEWKPRRAAIRELERQASATPISDIRNSLTEMAARCRLAITGIDQNSYLGWQRGDAWRVTVGQLARYFESVGLPHAASRNVDGSRVTPFVRFVGAWQSRLPHNIQQHHHSDAALASGVSRVWQIFRDRDK